MNELVAVPKSYTQARGRARRGALMDAARDLLRTHSLDQITLPMVAEKARIPASSTYHFYSDTTELFKDVARRIAAEMVDLLVDDRSTLEPRSWQELVRTFMESAAGFFNSDNSARQLMLGSRTPPDIKRAACFEDDRFGSALHALISRHFLVPKQIGDREGVFFRAIQVADLMFSLAVAADGDVTPAGREEGVRASIAYLGIYLPQILPRRPFSVS